MSKKPKFRYVPQRKETDCAVACMAMVTGLSYEQVNSVMSMSDPRGVFLEQSVDFITAQGCSAVINAVHTYRDRHSSNKRMMTPFADIHMVSVQPYADLAERHALVMLADGSIYDPAYKEAKKDYFLVWSVAGFYWDM